MWRNCIFLCWFKEIINYNTSQLCSAYHIIKGYTYWHHNNWTESIDSELIISTVSVRTSNLQHRIIEGEYYHRGERLNIGSQKLDLPWY